jgi:glycosyltransferase involved in cell wall biosynthesis
MLSVLIDTYNHEGFIRTAVESVLAQSWFAGRSDYEVVVVDDGSTDATPAVLAEFGDALRVVRKANGGQASAFTEGLKHVTGEIVLFLDGDDWWHEDKVARVMAVFEAHPECIAVGHGIVISDDLTGREEREHPPERLILSLAGDEGVRPFHENMAFLGTSRLAARREALDRVGHPPDALTYEADEYFFTLLPAVGEVHVLPDCLTWYRLHGGNLYQASNALAGKALGDGKLRKRAAIFRCLADVLPKRLVELGIPPARAAAVNEPLDIAATRLELQTGGGSRAATIGIERRSQAWLAGRGIGTRPLVRVGVFAAAALLPPASFYALRSRYAGSRARRVLNGLPQRANA